LIDLFVYYSFRNLTYSLRSLHPDHIQPGYRHWAGRVNPYRLFSRPVGTTMMRLGFRLLLSMGLGTGLATLVGCTSGSGKVPVSGSVVVDGAPGALTAVTFWSDDPNAPPGGGGRVMTNDKGEFSIGEKDKDTGLLPGNYKVTFSRFVDGTGRAVYGGGKKSEVEYEVPSKESIPEPYRDRSLTPISAQVTRSSNTFTFEVSTKNR